MIPYVCNLSPICGGLFYNHLQAADTLRDCSPLTAGAVSSAQSLLPICKPPEILQALLYLHSYKTCPCYLA